ncbi:hypothetical protein [Xylella fastidiosa]|nr:hypothetical protein [Xylella fastidiosa]MDG5823046.1 hypothetical protein [Xylella fastidiosa subsp. pauca]MDG5826317.1 hypothetical protein [Xylella fastidiosa subsp. pauca]WGZ31946.1 hypothetical protein O4444_10760 [Xylella fastidiosa subsp. pauca]WGZ34212.1 hypothetical protein O4445_11360 [Xylella fastidiosa subsp. pauca]WGZ36505.1 hypothetical protein O4443_11190 [Xylella fastidiosa subsp. pauca]
MKENLKYRIAPNSWHADTHMTGSGNDYHIILGKHAANPRHTKKINGMGSLYIFQLAPLFKAGNTPERISIVRKIEHHHTPTTRINTPAPLAFVVT